MDFAAESELDPILDEHIKKFPVCRSKQKLTLDASKGIDVSHLLKKDSPCKNEVSSERVARLIEKFR